MPTNGWNVADEKVIDSRNARVELPEVAASEDEQSQPKSREVGETRGGQEGARVQSPRPSEPHAPTPHSEDIRKIQVDDEDRLAFRVGVNALTLILLGFGIWLLITYVF